MIFRLAWVLVAAMAFGLQGCVVFGLASSMAGPPPVDPEFVPEKVPLLVIVRDPPDPMGLTIESDALALEIEREFTTYDIVPLVPSARAKEIRSMNLASFAAMTPAQVGQAVGAKQVLFVQINNSSLEAESDRQMIKGQIAVRVSVLDTRNGAILWPKDGSAGATLTYATPTLRVSPTVNATSVSRNVHQGLAVKIVRLFRKYKPDE